MLEQTSASLASELESAASERGTPATVQRVGSMLTLFFSGNPVRNLADASQCDHARFARFFSGMLKGGVHLPPSGYEAWFVSLAHDQTAIDKTVSTARAVLQSI
jgi:glutamate-1-semialdehyde 2,1-aminomutase